MNQALVIHPVMSYYAGGEFLCLNLCEALQDLGYHVVLACDVFDSREVERVFGLGKVMEKCTHFPLPKFTPILSRFQVLQRLAYGRRVWPLFERTEADVVFSTQSSPFFIRKPSFHFLYSVTDLFSYPSAATPPHLIEPTPAKSAPYKAFLTGAGVMLWAQRYRQPNWFFALGSQVLHDVRVRGYQNSSLIFPPCKVDFKPSLPKKRQIVQAARLIPDKRLELFFEIAERLPEYDFYIIGREDSRSKTDYPGYSQRLLSKLPGNVKLVNALVRERPELFEESMAYLYTGVEVGIGLALVEAISAGCIPLSPARVGGADVIEATGVGQIYGSAADAATKLRALLERGRTNYEFLEISKRARIFSTEVFRERMKALVSRTPPNIGLEHSTSEKPRSYELARDGAGFS